MGWYSESTAVRAPLAATDALWALVRKSHQSDDQRDDDQRDDDHDQRVEALGSCVAAPREDVGGARGCTRVQRLAPGGA